jgi:predicted AAA+ superfamily ATPase
MYKRWIGIRGKRSVLLLGPRRVGKTTLLKNLFPHIKYVTLDDLDHLSWAKSDPKGFVQALGKQAIIDEIQRFPLLTIAVKYAIDNEKGRYYMTGSSSLGLLDSAADSLAGRIDHLSLPPTCWGEEEGDPTHDVFREEIDPPDLKDAWRDFERALIYGGFPEIVVQKEEDARHEILLNYKNTYFTRDLMQLSNLENLEGLLGVLYNIGRSIGSLLEISNFARESGISFPTAKKYLNALEQAQLTFRLYGYQYGPAKRYLKTAKTYFCDNGIIHSLNLRLNEGQLLENFVLSELEKRRKLGFIKTDRFYYYKSAAGREIDLVYEVGDTVHAVEIKATRNPTLKDVRNLIEFGKSFHRPIKLHLFYLGERYQYIKNVKLIPVAALRRGK